MLPDSTQEKSRKKKTKRALEKDNLPIHELKALCVEQLKSMEPSEISHLLQDPNDKTKYEVNQPDSTSTEQETHQIYPETDQTEALDLFPESEDVEMLLADVPPSATSVQETEARSGQDLASNLTKMQMEILELELRARAIKALLRSQRPSTEEVLNSSSV